MPEVTVKEVRLPELHLPEIKRDEIVRALSGVHLPEVDLAKARRARIRVPTIALAQSDLGRLVATVAAVARFARPAPSRRPWLTGRFDRTSRSRIARIVQPRPRRSRWPLAFGAIIVAAFGAWALLRRPAVRQRIDLAVRRIRVRFDDLGARRARPEGAADEPVAVSAAETAPIEADPDAIPAYEESGTSG